MRPSEEVNQKVQEMYQQGQGYTNRSTHYTAEQAVSELRGNFLSDKWDQKVMVTVQTLKSKYTQWFKTEKMAADKAQKNNLQVVGEGSKEVEDSTAIVDTYKAKKSNLQVVWEDSEKLLEDTIEIVDTGAFTES